MGGSRAFNYSVRQWASPALIRTIMFIHYVFREVESVRREQLRKKRKKPYIPSDPKLVSIRRNKCWTKRTPNKPKDALQEEIDAFYKAKRTSTN